MIELWELGGKDGRRYSLFSWRTRMALVHKGLEFATHAVCMTDKAAIAFSGGKTVPVVKDTNTDEPVVVRDSWKIAEYLEASYPEKPLFGGAIGRGLSHTFNSWIDRAIVPAMLAVIVADIQERVDAADEAYFRQSMERILGKPLEQARAEREASLRRLAKVLEPLQAALKRQPYLCGEAAAYADYIVFSPFQWARLMSPGEVLSPEEPLFAWRARMLELHDGFAGKVPAA